MNLMEFNAYLGCSRCSFISVFLFWLSWQIIVFVIIIINRIRAKVNRVEIESYLIGLLQNRTTGPSLVLQTPVTTHCSRRRPPAGRLTQRQQTTHDTRRPCRNSSPMLHPLPGCCCCCCCQGDNAAMFTAAAHFWCFDHLHCTAGGREPNAANRHSLRHA